MSGIVPWTGVSPGSTVMPSPSFPSLRDWWRELQESQGPKTTKVESAVVGLRQSGESAAMGAVLALIDTDLGGLDLAGRIPLDWIGAALFYLLSIRDTGKQDGLADDFRALGQSCATVATYRMVQRWRKGQQDIPRNISSKDAVLNAGKAF